MPDPFVETCVTWMHIVRYENVDPYLFITCSSDATVFFLNAKCYLFFIFLVWLVDSRIILLMQKCLNDLWMLKYVIILLKYYIIYCLPSNKIYRLNKIDLQKVYDAIINANVSTICIASCRRTLSPFGSWYEL